MDVVVVTGYINYNIVDRETREISKMCSNDLLSAK